MLNTRRFSYNMYFCNTGQLICYYDCKYGNDVRVMWKSVVPSILIFYNSAQIQQNSARQGRTQNPFTLFLVRFGCVLCSRSDFARLSLSCVHFALVITTQQPQFLCPSSSVKAPLPFKILSEVFFLFKIVVKYT